MCIRDSARPVLFQNSPNPFNYSTSIKYNITDKGNVELSIYNLTGQKIAALINETQSKGTYSVNWNANMENGSKAPNGVYIYRLRVTTENKDFEDAGKMLLIR